MLAGYPTVGARTGGSFVRHEDTGVVVERLPLGTHCTETDDDVRVLAASEFDTDRILDVAITAVNTARLKGVSPHT